MKPRPLLSNHEGQGLVEYAMLIMLVILVVVGIVTLLGPAIGNMYSSIQNGFQ